MRMQEPETLPLFKDLPMPKKMVVDWMRVLALNSSTAKGRLLLLLLDGYWHSSVELSGPGVAGLAYRQRLSDLRDLGVIPEHRMHGDTTYYDYRLPADFIAEYRKS